MKRVVGALDFQSLILGPIPSGNRSFLPSLHPLHLSHRIINFSMHYEFMTYICAGVPRYGYPPVHPYYGPPGTVPNPYVYPGPLPTTGHSPMQDPSAKSNVATVTSGDSTLIPQPTHCELTIAF